MKDAESTMVNALPDNDTTPTLDTMYEVIAATLPPTLRWGLKGWAAHMRESRHQKHAANSWAKHRDDFEALRDVARCLAVARCVDFGMTPDEAVALLRERVEARKVREASELYELARAAA